MWGARASRFGNRPHQAAGRTFDRVTSAQAWHWLDLPLATSKAASLLRPGGRLCLIWNAGCQPDDLAEALEEVYASVMPGGAHRVFQGYAAERLTDMRAGLDSEMDPVSAVPGFGAPTMKWFPWTRDYQRNEWLDQLLSRSDHTALEPEVLDRLLEGIGAVIDDYGGSFVMNFESVLITAIRLAWSWNDTDRPLVRVGQASRTTPYERSLGFRRHGMRRYHFAFLTWRPGGS